MQSSTTKYCLLNGNIILPDEIRENHNVFISGDKITSIEPYKARKKNTNDEYTIINAKDKYICPGFIDIHIQGCGGADFLDNSNEALKTISETSAYGGTSSILATTTIKKDDKEFSHLRRLKKNIGKEFGGAKIIGIHLEGPYINENKKGGFSSDFIRKPSLKEFKKILSILGTNLKIITIAPEINNIFEIIKEARRNDIIVALGHSEADYELTTKAIKAGASHITHIFNAMRELHHREPGILGAALTNENVSVQIIADGYHLHKAILKLIYKLKGRNNTILITDGTAPTGLKEGMTFKGVGGKIICKNGAIRLQDGTLAGSALLMNQMLKSLINLADIDITDAIYMATMSPAKILGIESRKGSIEKGKDADITILDNDLNVIETFVSGKRTKLNTQ